VLLFLFPFTGLGAIACMTGATFVTAGVVIWADRRRERRAAEDADGPAARPAERRPMTPLAAAGLTLGSVVLLAYVIFIVVIAARGN
jgi:uncharacterized iron-regulated membrane protein